MRVLLQRYRANEDLSAELRDTVSQISALRADVVLSPNAPQPERYLTNLSSYASFMQRIIEKPLPERDMLRVIREIRLDFHAKAIFSKSSRGQPLRQIETIVNTMKDGKAAISGYEVWYVPKGLVDYSDEYRRFDNLSTPAIMPLPPGNYLIWASKGRWSSERRPLTLGNDGRSKRQYDLPVK